VTQQSRAEGVAELRRVTNPKVEMARRGGFLSEHFAAKAEISK
jgi:hypothetical protein